MARPDGRASARKSFVLLVMGTVIFFFASVSSADVPHMINYQGKLTTASGGCLNDTVQMTFSIYPDTLGSPADWSETQTEVVVKEGIFNVLLGAVDTIPSAVFDGNIKYLGVQVESDPEMRPLKPMVSVAYAFRSVESDTAQFAVSAAPDDDWDVDTAGLNVYRLTGGVGIGTPSPQEKLDVDGNIHASGTITSGSSITIDGANDKITATGGTIDFDNENLVTTGKATIGPGHTNTGVYAFVAGQNNTATGNNPTVSGGLDNVASNDGSTVGGGFSDTASGIYSTVAGGAINMASGQHSTVGGGNVNLASGNYSTVSGGGYDTASGTASCVGGGGYNVASGDYATVGGGFYSRARGQYSVVSGGGGATEADSNAAIGDYSVVPGGTRNIAGGNYSFAAGRRAKANHNGAFVWADQTDADFASSGNDQFLIRASGGVGIGTTSPNYKLDVQGTVGIDIGSYSGDIPLTIDVPSNQSALISRIAKGGSVINVTDKDGNVGIGTSSPQGALDVSSTTGAFIVPRMTTAQRDALTAVNGMIIYNTTTNQFNFYENGAWVTK